MALPIRTWDYPELYSRFHELMSQRPVYALGLLNDVGISCTPGETANHCSSPEKLKAFCQEKVRTILQLMQQKPEIETILSGAFDEDDLDVPVRRVIKPYKSDLKGSGLVAKQIFESSAQTAAAAAAAAAESQTPDTTNDGATTPYQLTPRDASDPVSDGAYKIVAGEVVGDNVCQFSMDE